MTETLEMLAPAPPSKVAALSAKHVVPFAERTDVTVDELQKTSLPYAAELYDGKVVFKMASPEHGIIQGRMITRMNLYLETADNGVAMTETNFRLWPERERQSRVPDIAFIRKERLPQDLRRFPGLAPDLAVEIISTEDNFLKVMNKVDEYLEQGTHTVWLVIPDTREVLVCTASSKYAVRDVLTAPELLPDFELPVAKIFEGLPMPEKTFEE